MPLSINAGCSALSEYVFVLGYAKLNIKLPKTSIDDLQLKLKILQANFIKISKII
jgi:hypothetical protein